MAGSVMQSKKRGYAHGGSVKKFDSTAKNGGKGGPSKTKTNMPTVDNYSRSSGMKAGGIVAPGYKKKRARGGGAAMRGVSFNG